MVTIIVFIIHFVNVFSKIFYIVYFYNNTWITRNVGFSVRNLTYLQLTKYVYFIIILKMQSANVCGITHIHTYMQGMNKII